MFSRPVIEAIQAEGVKTYTADISLDSSPDKQLLVDIDRGTAIPLVVVFIPGEEEPFDYLQGAYTQDQVVRMIERAREASSRQAAN